MRTLSGSFCAQGKRCGIIHYTLLRILGVLSKAGHLHAASHQSREARGGGRAGLGGRAGGAGERWAGRQHTLGHQ